MSPRVALVVTTTSDEPAPVLAARLRHLLDAGWDARLMCKGRSWAEEPDLRDPDLRERVKLAPRARPNSDPFARPLRRLAPDLVHFHSGGAARRALRDGRLDGVTVVLSPREDGSDLAAADPGFLWERNARIVFAHAAALERAVANGCPRERSVVLPASVPTPRPGAPRMPPNGLLRILSAGPLVWEQGFEHSVHAVRLLLDRGIECNYRIAGGGDHLEAVAFARHQLGVGDRVELLGRDGNGRLPSELLSADVFVDPAVTDTTPAAGRDAARAHGVPVVATDASAGLAVPRRDPVALADALARLAEDPALRDRLGAEGARVAPSPTPAEHGAALEAIYRDALAES